MKKPRKSYPRDAIMRNRDRKVEETFSTLEGEALRKFLSTDAPTRERKSNAHTNERDAHRVAK